jgi:hypothetical protein
MSSTDFFLVERAAQIQRLRRNKSDNPIRVPGRLSRLGYSPRALEFFRALDEISQIALEEKQKKNWLQRLRARGASLIRRGVDEPATGIEQPLLSSAARAAIETFETHIVPILLDEDETAHPVAEALVGAILRDAPNYFGLKPLQFHSEEFAYEFLFPSWLNLYTALLLLCSTTGKPRFSLEQIKAIFSRFQELEKLGSPPDPEWVAALAFLANRLPSDVAQGFFQRMFDLQPLIAQGSTATLGAKLGPLQANTASAPQLLALIKSLILFESVVYRDQVASTLRLGQRLAPLKPLPPFIAPTIQAIADQPDKFSAWAELVVQVARVIESGHGLDDEFAEILEAQAANLGDWLSLVVPSGDARVLSASGQRILARMIRRTQSDGQPHLAKIRDFARHIAPRLDLLDNAALAVFEKQFVEVDTNRDVLLASAGAAERRGAISQKLIAGAEKVSDRTRFVRQLAIAAVLDPEFDTASVTALGRTLHVLATSEEQGFISTKQLDQIADHLRERLPEAAAILAEPMLSVSGTSGPAAKLFLALSEVCMKYELTGTVENFGLTKGAYGNLGRAGK